MTSGQNGKRCSDGEVTDDLDMGVEYTFELRGLGKSRAGVGDLNGPAASITDMMPMPDEPDEEDAATLPEIPTGFTAYDARPDARRLVWEEVPGTSYELRYTADATAADAMWTDWEEQASGVTVYDLDMGMEYTFELRAGIGDLQGPPVSIKVMIAKATPTLPEIALLLLAMLLLGSGVYLLRGRQSGGLTHA